METWDHQPPKPDPPTDEEIGHVLKVARIAARRAGAAAHEVDDVAQRTAIKLWERWHHPNVRLVRDQSDFRWNAYVRQTAKRVHLDSIRSHQRRLRRNTLASDVRASVVPRRPGTVRQVPPDVAGISSLLGRNVIIAELAKLPPRQRLVAWLVFFHELSTREIADELGIQPQAVRKLLRSAKANLIDRIAESQHQSLQ